MKKLLLVAGIALLSLGVKAQEKQGLEGTWWVAGQVAFGSDESGDVKTTSNTILPIVGYFVAPTTTIGVGVGYLGAKTENGSTTTSETSAIVFKPLARKYWNVSGKFFFYGQAALPMVFGKDDIADVSTSSFGLELSPGFDYIVNDWMTVETSFTIFNVGYEDLGDDASSFNFNANPMNSISDRSLGGLQLGVKFLF